MLNDTLLGFSTLAETATENSLVVWINEYFGPVASDGNPIRIAKGNDSLFGKNCPCQIAERAS